MVSIIIRAKNGHELTRKCIESVVANTTGEYRLILVDDGSTPPYQDDSPECAGYVPPVEYLLRTNPSKGAVTATNIGLGVALQLKDAPYILVLDNDTEVPEGDTTWLQRFIAELEQHPKCGAIGATSNFAKGHQDILASPYTYTADWKDEQAKRAGPKSNPEVAEFVSFAVLMRRDAVATVGFWDERYNPGNFEDTDYAVQMRMAGWEMRVARSVYIHHKGNGTFQYQIGELMRENGVKFVQKWGPGHLWDLGLLETKQLAQFVKMRHEGQQ